MGKLDGRLEVRLDKRTLERLEDRAATARVSVSHIVRQAIARELEGEETSGRVHSLEEGLRLAVPVPADPGELARELAARHGDNQAESTCT